VAGTTRGLGLMTFGCVDLDKETRLGGGPTRPMQPMVEQRG
jgi:hypothetical protein